MQDGSQAEPQKVSNSVAESGAAIAKIGTASDANPSLHAEKDDAPLHLLVWTIERDRYGVRGRALCTMMEVVEADAADLCQGVKGYVLNAPNGETVVVEARTGGLVGYTLETVSDGIRDMPISELLKQIDSGKKEFDRMKQVELSNAMFWAELKMSDEDQPSITEYV